MPTRGCVCPPAPSITTTGLAVLAGARGTTVPSGAESAETLSVALPAVTRTRTERPRSASVRTYFGPPAPGMTSQPPPSAAQRSHA